MKALIAKTYLLADKIFDFLAPIFILLTRLYLTQVFFLSGLTKISNWQATLSLFQNEYMVPVMSPTFAAYLGTACELGFPVLITLGLGSRLVLFGLFLFNLFAVFSYKFLWTPDGAVGLTDHMQWGIMILMLLCTGPGKLSIDYLIRRFYLKLDN
ncbi:TPA: DoxX family protein [Legionella pneumophila]|nr:DoxX family protein [Legionella pneumophila]HBD7413874.1 DoxX family protein [Legionella pneumophila]HBD9350853.1 DoxX family protein [Legionella pneumophila]HBD9368947.1 DoxX family protein [Legionella pneumophila]HBD9384190.1 DoxX family protein [Legionella pneumophila]